MLSYLSRKNKIHQINPELQARMKLAQDNLFERSFSDASEFLGKVVDDLKIDVALPRSLRSTPCSSISKLDHGELVNFWVDVLKTADLAAHAIPNHAINLAQQTQLVQAFDNPENALGIVLKQNPSFRIWLNCP